MDNYLIKNIPSVERTQFKQRTVSSSDQLNTNEKQVFNDILDLFNKANLIQKEMYELNMIATLESSHYSSYLESALSKLSILEEDYKNLLLKPEDFRYNTKIALEAFVDDLNPNAAIIDKNTNDIISAITNSTSKIRIHDETYDESIIPPSLKAFIGPDSFRIGEHILSIEDNELNNCFDGDPGTVWVRKVITDATVNSIENEIVIGLPEDIITSRLINQIVTYPYPCWYLDILDIQYRNNGAWTTIPGFDHHAGYSTEEYTDIFNNKFTRGVILKSPNLKFNFDSIQTNQIKIKLRQTSYEYDAENNRRIWYLGLRNVDINYNRYTKTQSEFSMMFDFKETGSNIKVYDAEIHYNNEDRANVFKEYYYFDEYENVHRITDSIPFVLKGHKLMVKFTIEGASETPNIYKCTVKYKLS